MSRAIADKEIENNIIIYQTNDGQTKIDVKIEDETVWLNQSQIAESLQTTKENVSSHIQNIFKEKELSENSVVKDFLTTAADGKDYHTTYWKKSSIICTGKTFKPNNAS